MSVDKIERYLMIGLLGVGAYLLWKSKEKIDKGVDFIAEPIANAIIAVTMPGQLQLTGNVLFSSGYRVSINQLNVNPTTLTFSHLGQRYRIDHREGNDYIAVLA